jgi:hypothetical protein
VRVDEAGTLVLVQDEEKKARTAISHTEANFVGAETQKLIKSKKVYALCPVLIVS